MGTQEGGRPGDGERLVGQADDVVLAAEGGDAIDLGLAVVEEALRRLVLRGDGVEDALHEGGLAVRVALGHVGERLARHPVRPGLAGQAQHLPADGVVVGPGAAAQLVGRQVAAQREAQLAGEEVGAQAALTLGAGAHLAVEARRGRPSRASCAVCRGGLHGAHQLRGLALARPRTRLREAGLDELADALQLRQRGVQLQQRHRAAGQAGQAGQRLAEELGQTLEAGRGGPRRAAPTARTRARGGRRDRCP